ncbi:hypothetical protein SAMN05421742_105258 [Roseospirillum parvum]|uniref:DUF2336 domain-containing protein n=2 Tax=Roseospirillum parvum TaxID=83401 RepID=A0A1G8B7N5_9PROT|nr:hypothetical protein SAMN05421742_105258 [Roseospirillum parvum]
MGGDPASSLTYERARTLARHDDPAVRRELATRDDVVPEILYFLAEDPDVGVRKAIAGNTATPLKAQLLLARDQEEDVRADLAGKVARLCPHLSDQDHARIHDLAHQVLECLARDQIPRVRRILAETLKDVAAAPAEVMRRLARDAEVAVSTPVLEFSPVLTDEDLLEIIAEAPVSARLSAISRRIGVGIRVSTAIAETDDGDAITHLLANTSAQIREETLDRLIERAEGRPDWHDPLVRRPGLHSRAARRLACFVAANLLGALAARQDLDAETVAEVLRVVRTRLASEDGGLPATAPNDRARDDDQTEGKVDFHLDSWRRSLSLAYEAAQREAAKPDGLSHQKVLNRLARGEAEFVIGALAVLADLPPDVVGTIVEEHSAKGLLAVAWKGGFSARDAVALQMQLGRVAPEQAIKPNDDSGFHLSGTEMEWQLEMFTEAAGQKRPRSLDDALARHGM